RRASCSLARHVLRLRARWLLRGRCRPGGLLPASCSRGLSRSRRRAAKRRDKEHHYAFQHTHTPPPQRLLAVEAARGRRPIRDLLARHRRLVLDEPPSSAATDLATLATSRSCLVGGPLVGRALLVRRTSALARDLALLLGRHRRESA